MTTVNESFVIKQGGEYEPVPAGAHNAIFKELKRIETQYGGRYQWLFELNDGRSISAFSAVQAPTTKNKTGRFLAALSGKPLAAGTAVNPADYIGMEYMVIVVPSDNGGTKLEMFNPVQGV